MRKPAIAGALALALMAADTAHASTANNGYVTGFVSLGSGVMLVFTDGSRDAPPACSNSNYPDRWAFNATTPTGQGMLGLLLTARALHEPVAFYGSGACDVQGDAETIAAIVTNHVQ